MLGNRLVENSPVRQGFAIRVSREGNVLRRFLDRRGFPEVAFGAEYPIGRVDYGDAGLVVRVTLEAFSPFIWAWEGGGCRHGTCGHVWDYAHTIGRLFPELERSVREHQDFAAGIGLRADGAIGFHGEGWDLWAGDS